MLTLLQCVFIFLLVFSWALSVSLTSSASRLFNLQYKNHNIYSTNSWTSYRT